MRKLKYLISFIFLAIAMSLFSVWLAMNQISFIFSVAAAGTVFADGHPQNWGYIILNFVILSLFLVFIKFRRKVARLPSSIYLAFIVALYIEMYGFFLTMYFFSWFLGYENVATLWCLLVGLTGKDLFVSIFFGVILPISNMIIIPGMFLIVFGWSRIFRAKNQLVTTGIYGHVRHPQYLGFMLITLGMNVLWVTIPTLLLWPILAIVYYRLAKEEDKEMEEKFGEEYRKYKNTAPMFIPHLRIRETT
jgi:protein-S-isoprenylcysteine O-methyltransferase Ste14